MAILILAHALGSFSLGMLVLSASALACAFSEVPTGVFSDMRGRRATMLLGACFNILGIFLLAVGSSLYVLLLGGAMLGVAQACYSGNNEALLFESLKVSDDEGSFSLHYGHMQGMLQLGSGLAAGLGGVLALYSLYLALWVSLVPQVICLFLSARLVEHGGTRKVRSDALTALRNSFALFKRNRRLRLFTISSTIQYGINESLYLFSPAFVTTFWPLWGAGVARVIGHVLSVVSFWMAGPVIRKLSAPKVLIGSQVLSRVVGIAAAVTATAISPLLLYSNSLFYGTGIVAQQSLLQREFSDEERATLGSMTSVFGALAFSVLGYGFGFLADTLSPVWTTGIGEVLLIAAIIPNVWAVRGRGRTFQT